VARAVAMSSFRFVYIPADATQPMQELTQEVEPGKEVECLTNRLQQHFREQSASSAAIPKDARKQMLEQHVRAGSLRARPSPHLRRR
jgi:hypothetical protein